MLFIFITGILNVSGTKGIMWKFCKNISRNLNVTECYKHFDKPLKDTAVNLRNYESLVASIYIMVKPITFSLSIKVLLMRIQWTHHVPCFNTI